MGEIEAVITKNKKKRSSKSRGNQGSEVEYRRLIQKYGQSMSYKPNEIVVFFVPRLAQKGRYKDRIGKIKRELDDLKNKKKGSKKYEIIDESNGKLEIVPWESILN